MDPLLFINYIYLCLVGAGEYIRRSAFVNLLGKLLRAGEIKHRRHSGMINLKHLPDLANRFGERSCSEGIKDSRFKDSGCWCFGYSLGGSGL